MTQTIAACVASSCSLSPSLVALTRQQDRRRPAPGSGRQRLAASKPAPAGHPATAADAAAPADGSAVARALSSPHPLPPRPSRLPAPWATKLRCWLALTWFLGAARRLAKVLTTPSLPRPAATPTNTGRRREDDEFTRRCLVMIRVITLTTLTTIVHFQILLFPRITIT